MRDRAAEVIGDTSTDVAMDDPNAPELPDLGRVLDQAITRMNRRRERVEKPIPLPWDSFGGVYGPHAAGMWAGLHVLVSGTGAGKSTWALQYALHAARNGCPAAYVGLELEEMQIGVRLLSDAAGTSWSDAYNGRADSAAVAKLVAQRDALAALPFHPVFGKTTGWSPSDLAKLAKSIRQRYPEQTAGDRPALVVLDFLQLVGDDEGKSTELRERIGKAAYIARQIAREENLAILAVSSVARDKYKAVAGKAPKGEQSVLETVAVRDGKRVLYAPDLLVGLGKDSGEIEFAADSVTAAIKLPEQLPTGESGVLFAVPKVRSGPATWVPLAFNGFRFKDIDSEHDDSAIAAVVGPRKKADDNSGAKPSGKPSSKATLSEDDYG